MVTSLGHCPGDILQRIEAGDLSAIQPHAFPLPHLDCPVAARIANFQPENFISERKLVRLMGRDAQLAVSAAHLALQDAEVRVGANVQPEEVALFGATGLASLPFKEVEPLLQASLNAQGRFDLGQFGQAGLRAVNPVLSFKILANMPLCFVSICENIQGPNGIYTPWEGQGAQALEAAIRALQWGKARCALVGGCDVKTHEFGLLTLQQMGLFESWRETHAGLVPTEGAAFLVLEKESDAQARGARIYARFASFGLRTNLQGTPRVETQKEILSGLSMADPAILVSSANADPATDKDDAAIQEMRRVNPAKIICPKKCLGDLFAAAAPVQVGLAALLAQRTRQSVLAHCFGYGTEQAAFALEAL